MNCCSSLRRIRELNDTVIEWGMALQTKVKRCINNIEIEAIFKLTGETLEAEPTLINKDSTTTII